MLSGQADNVASLDLVPASQVSKSWRIAIAVAVSLRRSSRRHFPWLIFHLQSRRHPFHLVATLAYDPHSCAWIPISRTGGKAPPAAALHSSHPGLLYALSLSQLAISTDAFGSNWRHLCCPELCREDVVVALMGSRLIVAGGTCGFEGDPMTVEACDVDVDMWEVCEPLPEAFYGSASATWLSVAAGELELHVLEKREGLLSSFDAETKRWSRVCQLSTDPAVFLSAIGLIGERMIPVGAAGEPTAVESIKLWEMGRDSHVTTELREIGVMPDEMMGRMVGDGWRLSSSIGFSVIGELGYLYNPSELGEVFIYEFGEGTCRWASVGEPGEQVASHRVVLGGVRMCDCGDGTT